MPHCADDCAGVGVGACAGGGATKPCGCLFGSTGLGEGCVTTTVSTTVAVAVSTTVAVFVTVVLGSFFRVVVSLEVVVLDVVTALVVLVGAVFVVVETIAARGFIRFLRGFCISCAAENHCGRSDTDNPPVAFHASSCFGFTLMEEKPRPRQYETYAHYHQANIKGSQGSQ